MTCANHKSQRGLFQNEAIDVSLPYFLLTLRLLLMQIQCIINDIIIKSDVKHKKWAVSSAADHRVAYHRFHIVAKPNSTDTTHTKKQVVVNNWSATTSKSNCAVSISLLNRYYLQ